MVGLDDKYGFVFLPISKSAEIELVYQIPWQPPPSISIDISQNFEFFLHVKNKKCFTILRLIKRKEDFYIHKHTVRKGETYDTPSRDKMSRKSVIKTTTTNLVTPLCTNSGNNWSIITYAKKKDGCTSFDNTFLLTVLMFTYLAPHEC